MLSVSGRDVLKIRTQLGDDLMSLETRSQQDLRLGTNFGQGQLLETKSATLFCAQEQFAPSY